MVRLRKKILVFLIFSLLLLIPSVADTGEDPVQKYHKESLRDDYYKQGEILFKKGQYQEAILKFEEALRFDPAYEPAKKYIALAKNKIALQDELKEAEILAEKRQKEKAEKKMEVVASEREFKTLLSEGKFYLRLGEFEDAIAKFNDALNIYPQNTTAQKYIELVEERIAKGEALAAKRERARKIKEAEIKAIAQTQKLSAREVLAAEIPPSSSVYHIDKEDTLEISVWNHPELTREVVVRPDGMISYLLIGDIQAAGLTIPELTEKVTQELKEFSQKKLKPSFSKKPEEKAEYLIGYGDTLEISVWKVPDLSRDVIVRPDGMISFPLIGDLKVEGITLVQLDEQITKSLSHYVKKPQVSVMVKSFGWKKEIPKEVLLEDKIEVSIMIKKFGDRKVIVLGDVAKPGVYTFVGNLRLAEAIALAGDFTNYALRDNVLVIRGDIHSNPTVIYANMLAFLKNARLTENVLIQHQDVIFVPRSIVGNINSFLEAITPLVDTANKGLSIDELLRAR